MGLSHEGSDRQALPVCIQSAELHQTCFSVQWITCWSALYVEVSLAFVKRTRFSRIWILQMMWHCSCVCVCACARARARACMRVALLAETVKDLVLARRSHAERRGVIWPLYKLVQSQDRPVRQPCHTQQSRWQMDKWKWSFVYPHPTQLLKTEPRIKRESNIGCILCKVHMCGNGQSQKDKHYTDDAR